jgi:MFS family permease
MSRPRIAHADVEPIAGAVGNDAGQGPSDDGVTVAQRRRILTAVIFAGVALGSTAHLAIATVAALAVTEITGSSTLAGLPAAAGVVGTALGSLLLTRSIAGSGPTAGLVTGYAVGAVGAVVSLVAMETGAMLLLVVGVGLSGAGSAAGHLARYVASGMYPEGRRGAILGVITWASTIGSVLGPLLVVPFGRLTAQVGSPELAGGFLVGAVFMAAAAMLQAIGLRRASLRRGTGPTSGAERASSKPGPPIRLGARAMAVAQAVMVMVMTATPLHVHHHGGSLVTVGTVMMAHTIGMFGLSPLVGGAVDRFGPQPVMGVGLSLLGAASLASLGGTESTIWLALTLWALGVGWNLAFVAGSTIVAGRAASRPNLAGHVDALTWTSGGIAGIVSGIVFSAAGYRAVALLALGLLGLATLWLFSDRSRRRLRRLAEETRMAPAGDAAT